MAVVISIVQTIVLLAFFWLGPVYAREYFFRLLILAIPKGV